MLSIITLTNLTKMYGEKYAVKNLNLTIERGEIFGLLGPNGAGKTTTILMMLGLIEPTSGSVRVCGLDSVRQPLLVKERVGYLPDDVGFYEDRTGVDNVLHTALLNRIPRKEAEERAINCLKKVGLEEAMHQKTGTYSRGMRQRLGLADVLIKDPEVIILDEPTLGLDPEGVRELLQLIKALSQEEGITVLLSSHHLHQVQQICDRVGLFVKGELIAHGNINDLALEIFEKEPIRIDVQIDLSEGKELGPLKEAITSLDDVLGMEEPEPGHLSISCKRDMTAKLAELIVSNDYSLIHLSKKLYGLDEIYQRYFEGGEHHERETSA